MKPSIFYRMRWKALALALIATSFVVAAGNGLTDLSAPDVLVGNDGLFSIDDCPTAYAGLDVEIHEGEFAIDQIVVHKEGRMPQSINISEDDAITKQMIHFMDANFDGYVDIFVGPGSNREYSALILWDPEQYSFERATIEGFTVFNGYFFYYPEQKKVYWLTSSSAAATTITQMSWNGTNLVSEELLQIVGNEESFKDYDVDHRYTLRNFYSDEVIFASDDGEQLPGIWRALLDRP